jgi:hypothetical protein
MPTRLLRDPGAGGPAEHHVLLAGGVVVDGTLEVLVPAEVFDLDLLGLVRDGLHALVLGKVLRSAHQPGAQ